MGESKNGQERFISERARDNSDKKTENIRLQLRTLKESRKDSHLEFIDVDSLSDYDLEIFEKAQSGSLVDSDDEFKKYKQEVSVYAENEKVRNKDFKFFYDPKVNFLDMVLNKIVASQYYNKHPEKKAA